MITATLAGLLESTVQNVPLPWAVGDASQDYDEVYCQWHDLGPLNLPGAQPNKYELLMLAAINALPALLARIAALEGALEPFVRMEQSIMIDLQTAHNRGPGANSEMRSDDRDMRAELRRAFGLARAALTLKENDG